MFPSEKSNTSGLVPPAFTCSNSFPILTSINFQFHQQDLVQISGLHSKGWTFMKERKTITSKIIDNILAANPTTVTHLEFDTFCRSFTDRKALPTEADTCNPDWFFLFFRVGFSVFLFFERTPRLACFSCATHRRRADLWLPRWRIKPPGQAWVRTHHIREFRSGSLLCLQGCISPTGHVDQPWQFALR